MVIPTFSPWHQDHQRTKLVLHQGINHRITDLSGLEGTLQTTKFHMPATGRDHPSPPASLRRMCCAITSQQPPGREEGNPGSLVQRGMRPRGLSCLSILIEMGFPPSSPLLPSPACPGSIKGISCPSAVHSASPMNHSHLFN